jgi:hypothetical protein
MIGDPNARSENEISLDIGKVNGCVEPMMTWIKEGHVSKPDALLDHLCALHICLSI